MPRPEWQKWEHEVARRLGLLLTLASGSKFHDPGDVTDRSHPHDNGFRLIVDCKYTTKKSFSLRRGMMQEWVCKGVELGKRAVYAIRFHDGGDYVVLSMDDFEELLEKARLHSGENDGFKV